MNALLLPGVNALERFSFARKFQLLALLFLLPLCYHGLHTTVTQLLIH